MPRHSPILQILAYSYSKQLKCNIYSYIYYSVKTNKQTIKQKKIKEKNQHFTTVAFRETLETNLEEKN